MTLCGFHVYSYSRDEVRCTETNIRVPRGFPGFWVRTGDIVDLDEACPGHPHDNEYAIINRFNDAEWTDADEPGAVTVYP